MSILSNYIIQDLIQNVSKGVTETFKFVLEKYNSSEVFAYTLYIDDYCSYLGWAANTISQIVYSIMRFKIFLMMQIH